MDKDLLANNIEKAIKSKGLTKIKVCIDAGVGKDLIQNIRLGKKTELWRIADLAAYLGVTTSDLVGDTRASPAETNLLLLFRQMNQEGQERLLDQADDMVHGGKYIKSGQNQLGKEASSK